MADLLTLNLDELESRKKVKIGETVYTVRRLGAGEELDINQIIRELNAISEKYKDAEDSKLSDADEKRFAELQEKSLKIYAATFDDGGDGSKSMALIRQLSFADRAAIHDKIFGLRSVVDEVGGEKADS